MTNSNQKPKTNILDISQEEGIEPLFNQCRNIQPAVEYKFQPGYSMLPERRKLLSEYEKRKLEEET